LERNNDRSNYRFGYVSLVEGVGSSSINELGDFSAEGGDDLYEIFSRFQLEI